MGKLYSTVIFYCGEHPQPIASRGIFNDIESVVTRPLTRQHMMRFNCGKERLCRYRNTMATTRRLRQWRNRRRRRIFNFNRSGYSHCFCPPFRYLWPHAIIQSLSGWCGKLYYIQGSILFTAITVDTSLIREGRKAGRKSMYREEEEDGEWGSEVMRRGEWLGYRGY